MQERQRQGIQGIYMNSIKERLDQQQLQKVLGEVIYHTKAIMDAPAPDRQALATVVLSRQVLDSIQTVSSCCGDVCQGFEREPCSHTAQ